MPAPVSSLSSRTGGKVGGTKPLTNSHSNKSRIARRRGRARHTIESDDEIEREAGTDSDSDQHGHSSLDSDSDVESVSQRVLPNGHSRLSSPSTTQSPESLDHAVSRKHETPPIVEPAFFGGTTNWSEMVADENANGPADLPVIEFADFGHSNVDQRTLPTTRVRNKRQKSTKKPSVARPSSVASAPLPAPTPVTEDREEPDSTDGVASSSSRPSHGTSFPRREIGQSARQAYQHRLESDPSYVPTVGEFWGHDDRLLDKDLRSLSGWWRGRWQGRGRGRGFYRGFSARGGSAPVAYQGPMPPPNSNEVPEGERGGGEGEVQPDNPSDAAPPIERAWTHDGFEEMKRKEERRRVQEPAPTSFRGGLNNFRGGRPFSHGRGGFGRGGFSSSPTRPRSGLPFVPYPGKTWFAMKPERGWTKQHDAFLHFEKPRRGQGPAFRVRLPGDPAKVIRAPLKSSSPMSLVAAKLSTASVLGSEDGEKLFVVRLPAAKSKAKVQGRHLLKSTATGVAEESIRTGEEPPIDDPFVVRPRVAGKIAASSSTQAPVVNGASAALPRVSFSAHPNNAGSNLSSSRPDESPPEQQPPISDATRWAQTEEAVLRNPPTEAGTDTQQASAPRPSHTVLPALQTVFPPISQSPPSFGSHYTYGPALPPGIAMNQHGLPYELATGRAVYLQPPPPMFNPRPIMHAHLAPSMPFVPGHMHHHSTVSPDFVSQPPSHTPPVNGFIDPSLGSPIFSLPRSSRVEIRAPTDQSGGKSPGKSFARKPSGLRSGAPSEPSDVSGGHNYFPDAPGGEHGQEGIVEEGHIAQQHPMDPAMMPYPLYQQQYYYPEAFGYAPYMDMSQVAPYEMYPPDPRAPPQAVYY